MNTNWQLKHGFYRHALHPNAFVVPLTAGRWWGYIDGRTVARNRPNCADAMTLVEQELRS